MAPRTVANEDSLGKGPKEFVYVGRVKGYPKEAFIDYLRARMRFTESKEAVQ
jgi:predicted Ser/Thr protein kinase